MAGVKRSELEIDLIKIWGRPVSESPVYKDLPRLASRIVVEGFGNNDLSNSPKINFNSSAEEKIESGDEEVSMKEFIEELAKKLGKTIEDVKPVVDALEKEWYTKIDPSLLLISDEKWQSMGIPMRIVSALKEAAEKRKSFQKLKDQKNAFKANTKKVSSLRLKDTRDTPTEELQSADKLEVLPDHTRTSSVEVLPEHNRTASSDFNINSSTSLNSLSLNSSTTANTLSPTANPQHQRTPSGGSSTPSTNQTTHNRTPSAGGSNSGSTGNAVEDAQASKIRQMKDVVDVLVDVASRVETDSALVDKIKSGLEKVLAKTTLSDLELEVQSIFEDIVGRESKTARVFAAIHQNIIFSAIIQLKQKLPLDVMTRDVRSREGWIITVSFFSNLIVVTHKRREQSLATAKPEEQFYFEWQLHMYFDRAMTSLESAVLKVTDLQFGQTASVSFRMNIQRQLSSGNLIVT